MSTSLAQQEADPEVLPQGPITRSKAQKFREVLNVTCLKFVKSLDEAYALENRFYNVLHAEM